MVKFEGIERLEGESQNAWLAFRIYLHQEGRRSIDDLAKETGLSRKTLLKYSSIHKWKKRAALWDEAIEKEVSRRIAKNAGEYAIQDIERLDEVYRRFYEKVVGVGGGESIFDDPRSPPKLFVDGLFEAQKTRRAVIDYALSRMDAIEESPWNLDALTTDELKIFLELADKAGGLE